MIKTPCEMMIWAYLPALRRELVKVMVAKGLERKAIAAIFDISEPAISQYIKSKRGAGFRFDPELHKAIEASAEKIIQSKEKEMAIIQICKLCSLLKRKGALCALHRKENPCMARCGKYKTLCGA